MSAARAEAAAPAPAGASPEAQVVGPTLRRRLVRARPFLLALLLVAAVAVATATRPSGSTVPMALDNIQGDGARALAEVMGQYGIDARPVRTLDQAVEKAAQDPDNTTLVVLGVRSLSPDELVRLSHLDVDLVVLGTSFAKLDGLTEVQAAGASASADLELTPGCEDPDAQAAATLNGTRGSLIPPTGGPERATGCFPVSKGFAYMVVPQDNGRTLRLIADSAIARNDTLTQAGNAALLVRSLGHKEKMLWFDASHQSSTSVWSNPATPAWLPVAMLTLAATTAVLALVRGRRMGRLVHEDLPVQVPAAETTLGLGRLYRRADDRAHAARALRRGATRRIGHRLGLSESADSEVLLDELVRQAGRSAAPTLRQSAKDLLYGPPPSNDQELTALAERLDHLESEVQNR